jgi:hypothetical protein
MDSERDTHFAGFAKLVVDELERNWLIPGHPSVIPIIKKDMAKIIAQRAFDLACHTLYETGYGLDKFYILERIIEQVPDLTEFPKE